MIQCRACAISSHGSVSLPFTANRRDWDEVIHAQVRQRRRTRRELSSRMSRRWNTNRIWKLVFADIMRAAACEHVLERMWLIQRWAVLPFIRVLSLALAHSSLPFASVHASALCGNRCATGCRNFQSFFRLIKQDKGKQDKVSAIPITGRGGP
jgi:hypothetical protein